MATACNFAMLVTFCYAFSISKLFFIVLLIHVHKFNLRDDYDVSNITCATRWFYLMLSHNHRMHGSVDVGDAIGRDVRLLTPVLNHQSSGN